MIIGLCGAAGAGKGSVANALVTKYFFTELAFADPLYAMVSTLTGLTVEQLHDREVKEKPIEWLGKSPRQLLQSLGTEWGRGMVKDDLWVGIAIRTALASARVVLTDVRFDNEAQAVKDAGGVVWRVVRDSHSCLTEDTARHASEAGVSRELVDLTIYNNGTLEALAGTVDAAMRKATRLYNGGIAPCSAS